MCAIAISRRFPNGGLTRKRGLSFAFRLNDSHSKLRYVPLQLVRLVGGEGRKAICSGDVRTARGLGRKYSSNLQSFIVLHIYFGIIHPNDGHPIKDLLSFPLKPSHRANAIAETGRYVFNNSQVCTPPDPDLSNCSTCSMQSTFSPTLLPNCSKSPTCMHHSLNNARPTSQHLWISQGGHCLAK